jgi:regulatory protein
MRGAHRACPHDLVSPAVRCAILLPMRPAGPPPTEASLHDAALSHLARWGTSAARLVTALDRRIERWANAAEAAPEARSAARAAARAVVARLVAAGAVDDSAFATARVRSLTRAGRSARSVSAHLAARGVDAATRHAALPADPERELAAAIGFARRRRIGPFRRAAADLPRELGMFARAGFARDIAEQALRLDPDAAEALLTRLRES